MTMQAKSPKNTHNRLPQHVLDHMAQPLILEGTPAELSINDDSNWSKMTIATSEARYLPLRGDIESK